MVEVKLFDIDGNPVEIRCGNTNELQAAIRVLQLAGVLYNPHPDEETEVADQGPGVTGGDAEDGQERPGA